jgi:tetratricopeptide (TPR) repeat protein
MADELDDAIHARITKLSSQGDDLVTKGKYEQALERYKEALSLIPEPLTKWEACTWLLTAIGETYFFNADFEKARDALQSAMHCPGGIGNPLIHLRLGQTQFELGNTGRAKDELARAYMGGGEDIFDDEDPKYFALVKTSMKT